MTTQEIQNNESVSDQINAPLDLENNEISLENNNVDIENTDESITQLSTEGEEARNEPQGEVAPSNDDSLGNDVINDVATDDIINTESEEIAEIVKEENDCCSQEFKQILENTNHLDESTTKLLTKINDLDENSKKLQSAISGYYTETTNSMHRELEKFRKGLVRKLEQELFMELIDVYDSIGQAMKIVSNSPEKALDQFKGVLDQIDCALFNRSVESILTQIGDEFNPRVHHAISPNIPTGDSSLDGKIAEVLKVGFGDADEMYKDLRDGFYKLRPVHVRIYKFDESLIPQTEETTQEEEQPVICENLSDNDELTNSEQ